MGVPSLSGYRAANVGGAGKGPLPHTPPARDPLLPFLCLSSSGRASLTASVACVEKLLVNICHPGFELQDSVPDRAQSRCPHTVPAMQDTWTDRCMCDHGVVIRTSGCVGKCNCVSVGMTMCMVVGCDSFSVTEDVMMRYTGGTLLIDPVPGSLGLLQPPERADKSTGVPRTAHRLHTL